MNPRQCEYTFIEVLLVIAILSLISSFAINTYRKNYQNKRIDQVALAMQHMLAAAIAYNADNGHWPAPNNNLPTCTPSNSNDQFIKNYLPHGIYQSNYGNNFCWAETTTFNTKNRLFWVALKMPFTDPPSAKQIAQRIAARLPNGIVLEDPNKPTDCTYTSSNCYVRTEVMMMSANNKGADVAGAGYCDPRKPSPQQGSAPNVTCRQEPSKNNYVIKFSCPATNTAKIYIAPNYYLRARTAHSMLSAILTEFETNAPDKCPLATGSSTMHICNVSITTKYDNHADLRNPPKVTPDAIGIAYTAICMPPSTPIIKTQLW